MLNIRDFSAAAGKEPPAAGGTSPLGRHFDRGDSSTHNELLGNELTAMSAGTTASSYNAPMRIDERVNCVSNPVWL